MALYMTMLSLQGVAFGTIKTTKRALSFVSELYKHEGIVSIGLHELQQAKTLAERKGLHLKASTVNQYIGVISSMARKVYDITINLTVERKDPLAKEKNLIDPRELTKIIEHYKNSPSEDHQLFGFCLYLLFTTGARNETI